MTNYRDIALRPDGKGFTFQIGPEEYIADDLPGARLIIDDVLSESYCYRDICAWPEGDDNRMFEVGGTTYNLDASVTPRPQLEAAIRAIVDSVLGAMN